MYMYMFNINSCPLAQRNYKFASSQWLVAPKGKLNHAVYRLQTYSFKPTINHYKANTHNQYDIMEEGIAMNHFFYMYMYM